MNVYTESLLAPERWMVDASCAQTNPDAWFPGSQEEALGRQAKRVCRDVCPVRAECLEFALRTGQRDGIWAGYSPRSLEKLRREGRS